MSTNQNPNGIEYLNGPMSRRAELRFVLQVFWDLFNGIRKLYFTGPCVTVFGSARTSPEDPFYKAAEQIAAEIARLGFTIMTGGGPVNSSQVLPTDIYFSAFQRRQIGYAAAEAVVMFLILFALSVFYVRRAVREIA